jgi:hypothetical protein
VSNNLSLFKRYLVEDGIGDAMNRPENKGRWVTAPKKGAESVPSFSAQLAGGRGKRTLHDGEFGRGCLLRCCTLDCACRLLRGVYIEVGEAGIFVVEPDRMLGLELRQLELRKRFFD